MSLFGISAKFIDAVGNAGIRPADTHDLSAVRTICSTGSPLSPEGFEVVYDRISADVHLASISGGTDLCGCLVAGDPTSPVWAGEIQKPGLGMAIDVVDGEGGHLPSGQGRPRVSCPLSVDAARLLGRSRRCPLPPGLLRGHPRLLAPG